METTKFVGISKREHIEKIVDESLRELSLQKNPTDHCTSWTLDNIQIVASFDKELKSYQIGQDHTATGNYILLIYARESKKPYQKEIEEIYLVLEKRLPASEIFSRTAPSAMFYRVR